MATFVGIADIEIIFEPLLSGICSVYYRNTFGVAVHPSTKALVPRIHLQHRRGIGALCIQQNLFVKRQAVIATCRVQKIHPVLCVFGDAGRLLTVQLGNQFIPCRHVYAPPFIVPHAPCWICFVLSNGLTVLLLPKRVPTDRVRQPPDR